jgi:hypothetical protein
VLIPKGWAYRASKRKRKHAALLKLRPGLVERHRKRGQSAWNASAEGSHQQDIIA